MVGLIAVSDHSTIKVTYNAGLRIAKLNAMTDAEFAELDLIPDFVEGA